MVTIPDTPPAVTPDAAARSKLETSAVQKPAESPRMVSLDVFRGITIAFMILVNNAGDWNAIYGPLKHADWHGWTLTDLVFPFFLFIVGVSIILSFAKRQARGDTRSALVGQLIRRSAILFAMGLFMAGFPYFNFERIRIPGVLQRIAICYLIAGIIYLVTRLRGQIVATVLLLVGYWVLVTTVPVPRYGAGNLSPAGSLQAFVDSAVLSGHTYRGATWDPEGTVSTLPAIATVLFGILTGHWLKAARTPQLRTAGLLVGGAADVLIGQIMSIWLPINKYLWTSSYAVFTAGLAMIFFGVCYWLVDVKAIRWWTKPLVVFGMNAIAVFVLSGLLAKSMTIWKVTSASGEEVFVKNYLYDSFFAPLASPINASLLWALVYVLVWLGIMWLFYWRKIFLKI